MSAHPTRTRKNLARSCLFVSFVVVLLFLSGCAGGAPKHPTWKNATGAEQYERLMWQAIHDKDWKEVEYHLAPTFVGVNGEGRVLDRSGWIEYWKSDQIKEFSLGEVSVHPAGADMVITFVLHLSGAAAGRSFPQRGLRFVSVWQQVKSGWTLTATSAVPVTSD